MLEERSLRAAMQPKIDLTSNAEAVMGGNADLEFKVEVELMPTFEVMDLKTLKLERPVAKISDDDVNEQLKELAKSQVSYEPRDESPTE